MKPDLYGFITTMIKVTYVIWQLQGLPKTSSNPPTFSESPIPKIGSGRKRLISEHKGFLPSSNRKSGGRGHVGPYLCRRPSTGDRLSDCHPCSIRSGRGSREGYFLWPSRGLIGSAGPFSTSGGGGGEGGGGGACCPTGCPPGRKRSTIILRRTTMASLGSSALASEESTDSAST